ncbi:MAG: hypothetical protein V1894_06610 [Chloroflexota bacterium]
MAYGGGAAAAAYMAAIARATKASGAIVRIEPEDFSKLIARVKAPLVVIAPGGVFRKDFRYLTSYKGLFFFTKSATELQLPADTELVRAKEIWIPG